MNEKNMKVKMMQLSNREQELLINYQNWLKEKNLIDKFCAYFMKENLVLQVWDLQNDVCESVWQKVDKDKWEYCNNSSNYTFNIDFSLNEIFKRQKDFVLHFLKQKPL